jgi:hypothetical protein
MSFESFIPDILAAVIGGAILTYIFFIMGEKVFKSIDLNGSWAYEQETTISGYNPYKGMTVRFLALLAHDGNTIYGSAEKVYEKTSDGKEIEYIGKNRTLVKITGHIEKRYLSKDRIFIHITEFGQERESSTFHILNEQKTDKNALDGRFSSTIANQQGFVKWTRCST